MPSQFVATLPEAPANSAKPVSGPQSACCETLARWTGQKSLPLPSEIDLPALDELDRELSQLLAASHPKHTLSILEALRANYGEWANRREDLSYALHRDWLEDLADVPGSLLVEACKRWRRASNPPNKRPPHTAGELIALIERDWGNLKFLAYQSRLARNHLNGGHNEILK